MVLKAIYEKLEDIPEAFRELYTERDGKHELTGIEGVKTTADVERVQEGLRKEKADHKLAKDQLALWKDLDPEEVREKLHKFPELEAAAEGKIDEDKMAKIVDARVATAVAPINRELEIAKAAIIEKDAALSDYQGKDTSRTVSDAVRKAAMTSKVIDTALDDVLMLGEKVFEITDDGAVVTRDEVGVTPGVAPDIWLSEMQSRRPHWWPVAAGGGGKGSGAGGGFANNPFSTEHWNLTKQGEAIKEDRSKADRMAQAAGTIVGGGRPVARKTAA